MPASYKFVAWLLEMVTDALSCYIVCSVMSHSGVGTVRDVIVIMAGIFSFFSISGYMVTTLIARMLLREKWRNLYPAIAALLFLTHFEIMNLWVPGGLMEPRDRLIFRVVESVAVFFVAGAISLVLERSLQNGRDRKLLNAELPR